MDAFAFKKLKKRIHFYYKAGRFHKRNIYLYGGGKHIRKIKECLEEYNIPVSGVIDTDDRKSGGDFMGITIRTPEEYLQPFDHKAMVLILSSRYYRQMTAQLAEMGYLSGKHFLVFNDVIGKKNDESLACMVRMIWRNLRGLNTYNRLSQRNRRTVFVVPYNGSGNVYVAGLLFQGYLEKYEITDYVFIVASNMCKRVASLFGIQNVQVMSPDLIEDLIQSQIFWRTGDKLVNLHDGWRSDISRWLKGYKGLNFEQFYRKIACELDDAVPHQLPAWGDCKSEVDALFEKYGLQEGKTLVLSPYANTLCDTHASFWENIVDHYRALGFSVCTNCAAPGEVPLKNTVEVFFPFSCAVPFLERAGAFIGLRSGLCDIISSAKCKKVILYEKYGVMYCNSSLDYFSINQMGLCDDAIEIEYTVQNEKENLALIFNLLN